MNQAWLERVVEAVLYEGYILYPYRPSARKNQQRFTFGRVYPQAYSTAEHGAEPCLMQTEGLLQATTDAPALTVTARFLQPMTRGLGRLTGPSTPWVDGTTPEFELVPELEVDGVRLQSWQEAVERTIPLPHLSIPSAEREQSFEFDASLRVEPARDGHGATVGVIRRRLERVQGRLRVSVQPLEQKLFKVTVRVLNTTPLDAADLASPDAVLMRTFASTHTILQAHGAEFISLLETPAEHRVAAAQCRNLGTWPVLVGQAGERDTMLSSPIILYDYPQIAPESPGALFDSTEIDEILTLRILTLTEAEKRELRQADGAARQLLERTEELGPAALRQMHGTLREVSSLDEAIFGADPRALEGVTVAGVYMRTGDRVRLRPKGRADVMDLALNGKTAIIEAVEQDAENRVHLAVVVEDDPGKDLGFRRLGGHRFFYGPEEVEPLVHGPGGQR